MRSESGQSQRRGVNEHVAQLLSIYMECCILSRLGSLLKIIALNI